MSLLCILKTTADNLLVNSCFSKLCVISTRNSKYSVPIEWKRPSKLLFCDPKRTGDVSMEIPVDWDKPPLLYEQSKEYQTANDLVKKSFSCKFLGRKSGMTRYRDELINLVKNHKYDTKSPEVRIAARTAIIRNLYHHHNFQPYDKKTKHYFNDIIQKRKRQLRFLRKWDYKKFEWLLEKLDLIYRPYPVFERVERKKSIRKLTEKYCEEFVNKKLENYKQQLNDQKADFLKEKLSTLEWIKQIELEFGENSTITDEQIAHTKELLAQEIATKPAVKEEINKEFRLTT